MIRRRAFLRGAAVTLLAAPRVSAAQPSRIPRVGILVVSNPERTQALFRAALREFGYVEGQNIVVEYRSAPSGQSDRLGVLATELVRLKVDVIVAQFTPSAHAAKRATADIPIVMAPVGDPVRTGLIASFARPGGNITGVASSTSPEFSGKLVQLIKELLPALTRLGLLVDTRDPFAKNLLEGVQSAAQRLGVQVQVVVVRQPEEFDGALAAMARERAGAVVIHPILATQRTAELAVKHRLPPFSGGTSFPEAGGLMAYGFSPAETMRRVAAYVDRILKGAKPADLPVEYPTKFDLIINAKTARMLGLTIPRSLLLRADHVIE